jgi:hypothetical protein
MTDPLVSLIHKLEDLRWSPKQDMDYDLLAADVNGMLDRCIQKVRQHESQQPKKSFETALLAVVFHVFKDEGTPLTRKVWIKDNRDSYQVFYDALFAEKPRMLKQVVDRLPADNITDQEYLTKNNERMAENRSDIPEREHIYKKPDNLDTSGEHAQSFNTSSTLIQHLRERQKQIREIADGNADALGKIAGIEEAIAIAQQLPVNSDIRVVDGNWPEDASHENGNYTNRCSVCHCLFTGHKRRGLSQVLL